ncbi:MAG: 7-cyano-7-deazaguanine synthase QueC [Thermodesulfovibrionales bacterium]
MTTSTDPPRAVVLLSGGLDSSTTLALALAEGYETYAITFDYHQRHRIELQAARQVGEYLGVARHLTVSFDLREIGGSALTADIDVPKNGPASDIPVTYVPARNTIFLSFALAWAEVLQASTIFIGVNEVDYSGYPDCRPEYLEAYEQMANLATRASVGGTTRFVIKAPLLSLSKAAIIKKGVHLGLDYGLTWSCYDPVATDLQESKGGRLAGGGRYLPCGACDSCRIRQKGFAEAGLPDPLLQLIDSHAV